MCTREDKAWDMIALPARTSHAVSRYIDVSQISNAWRDSSSNDPHDCWDNLPVI